MAERVRILLADSDEAAARAFMSGLRARGVETTAATDAAQVVNLARKEKPDVVVLNAALAGGSMLALKRLRSNVYTTHIPVIAIAPAGVLSKQMVAGGAQTCLPMPIDFEKLDATIRENLLQELDFTQAPKEELEAPERLQDLRDSGLLDTPPEKAFDALTRLAASLCGAPTALVSLVDKDRQFFKSQVGLAEPWAGERQTRLSHSFCQWVVAGKESLVVDDATQHPVLKSNLAVRDLGVVAYAGMPIHGRSGQAIGSFCAIDSKRRAWSDEELATLQDLARIAHAYVVLGEARRTREGVRNAGAAANLQTSAHVAGHAIAGAAHILRRHGEQLDGDRRADLLGIIEEQADFLVQCGR